MQKKSLIIFGVVIVILLIIAFVLIFKKDKTDRLLNLYDKIRNSQNFTFTMEEQNQEYKYKVSMAQRGTDISIDMYSDEEHTTTIALEKEAYFITHDTQEYYSYENEEIESDIVLSGLHNMSKTPYVTGREEIYGKQYYYEEFDNENADFIIFADANEKSSVKTRFYFDRDKLLFIKSIVTDDDGETMEELLKISIEYTVDDSVFEIPEDYAEVEE